MRQPTLTLIGLALLAGRPTASVCAQYVPASQAPVQDPPGRVGRVSLVTGQVSLRPVDADSNDWNAASLNYPLTSGDALWTDFDSRAELHVGSSAVRLAPMTSVVFDAIDDSTTQVRLTQGTVEIRIRELEAGEVYQVDTPQGSVSLYAVGTYRIDLTPDGRRSTVTVRDGEAQAIALGGGTEDIAAGSSLTMTGLAARPFATGPAPGVDEWEQWCNSRDAGEDAVVATNYVLRETVGYEDLDGAGDWLVDATYGPVWYPRGMVAGWAPYRFGHWISVAPWGWTWVDDAAWGFAPFHYGRWVYLRNRWGWVMGDINNVRRPVYSPALVAYINTDSWGPTFTFGGAGGVAWVPLAPGEPYIPPYPVSPTYLRVVNVGATRRDLTVVDVNTLPHANRAAGTSVVPRDAFVRSEPVGARTVVVRPEQIATMRFTPAPVVSGKVLAAPRPQERYRPAGAPPPVHPPVAPQPRPLSSVRARPVPPPASGRGRPTTPPPPAGRGTPVTPPPPAGRSSPVTPPAQTPPPPPPGDRGRQNGPPPAAQGAPPPVTPPVPATGPLTMAQWQSGRQQIVTRQQQDVVAMGRRHTQEVQAPPAGETTSQVVQRQAQERNALALKQKQELAAFDKRKPAH